MIRVRVSKETLSEMFKKGNFINGAVCTSGVPEKSTIFSCQCTGDSVDLYFNDNEETMNNVTVIYEKVTDILKKESNNG